MAKGAKSSFNSSTYETLIAQEQKKNSAVSAEFHFFLPMLRAAENALLNFTTVDIAKLIFELLQFQAIQNEKGSFPSKSLAVLYQAEEEYVHHLERMRLELSQLFQLSPPYIHAQIKTFIEQEVDWLKKQLLKGNVLNLIKDSNNYSVTKTLTGDGEIRKLAYKRQESDKVDLIFLKSKQLDSYLDILQFILQDFIDAASIFIDPSYYYNVNRRKYPKGFLYEPPRLVNGIIREDKWDSFIAVCDYFVEGHTYSFQDFKGFHRKKIIPEGKHHVIEHDKASGVYKWKGFDSDKSASLRDFIKLLYQLELFELDNRGKQGQAFFDFFHVQRKDTSYLFRTIFKNDKSPYTAFFEQAKPELKSIIKIHSKNSKI